MCLCCLFPTSYISKHYTSSGYICRVPASFFNSLNRQFQAVLGLAVNITDASGFTIFDRCSETLNLQAFS